ncbi:hypothetical protein H0H87_007531 [Tephrocybe sp. NHM501043]|nr:hypothetical protein H0H87_007531 [Tephrocybe sp. NHM501043]
MPVVAAVNSLDANYAVGGRSEATNGDTIIDYSFLIFQLVGTYNPTTLDIHATFYAKIPIMGRIEVTKLQGNLKDGITSNVNLVLAKGTVGLRLAGKQVICDVDLDIKFIGKIKQSVPLFVIWLVF